MQSAATARLHLVYVGPHVGPLLVQKQEAHCHLSFALGACRPQKNGSGPSLKALIWRSFWSHVKPINVEVLVGAKEGSPWRFKLQSFNIGPACDGG